MDEKIKILKMVEEGKITAEEGIKLIEAVESKEAITSYKGIKQGAKWLKLRVCDIDDNLKVNMNIPLALVETGLKIGMAYDKELKHNMKDFNLDEIVEAVKSGAEGKIIDIETEKGEKVEIYVE